MTDTTDQWQPIATAPRDREIRLRRTATLAVSKDDKGITWETEQIIVHGIGQYDAAVHKWTGILGGNPDEWMDIDDA